MRIGRQRIPHRDYPFWRFLLGRRSFAQVFSNTFKRDNIHVLYTGITQCMNKKVIHTLGNSCIHPHLHNRWQMRNLGRNVCVQTCRQGVHGMCMHPPGAKKVRLMGS